MGRFLRSFAKAGLAWRRPVFAVKDKTRPHPKPRQRQLSVEEIELWLKVTEHVTASKNATLPALTAQPKPPPNAEPEPKRPLLAPELPKPQLFKLKVSAPPPVLAPLERRVRQKLSRGQLVPEASIDLHGMGQHDAYGALQRFLKE